MKQKKILLTFDLEEFDLPLEFKEKISFSEQIEISRKGFSEILKLLNQHKISATFFVTASFALANKKALRQLADKHEIGLHGLVHKDDYRHMKEEDALKRLSKGKKIVERIIGKKIIGFRAPRFHIKKIKLLPTIGIKYDSSLHPTYIPGRYNNFFTERKIHRHGKLVEVPVSVTSLLRLPLFWFVFRNFSLFYSKFCTRWCFLDSDYVMLLFHPWEFVNLNELRFRLPAFIRRDTGKVLFSKLDSYIKWAKRNKWKFSTISTFLRSENIALS
ncbi:MAG: polysaccharide deacetylase family protein [archaeon]